MLYRVERTGFISGVHMQAGDQVDLDPAVARYHVRAGHLTPASARRSARYSGRTSKAAKETQGGEGEKVGSDG